MSFFVKADEVDWQGKKRYLCILQLLHNGVKFFLIRVYLFLVFVHLDFLEIFPVKTQVDRNWNEPLVLISTHHVLLLFTSDMTFTMGPKSLFLHTLIPHHAYRCWKIPPCTKQKSTLRVYWFHYITFNILTEQN